MKVLSVKGKFKVIRDIENGKHKTNVYREFVLASSVKRRIKIISAFEWNGLGIENVIIVLQNYGTVSVASDM